LIPGDVIIARGHVVKEIYYIVEGKAKVVSKRGENVKVLGEGSFCGEFALF
jgi:CRP-like cAMP-binding protein